MKASRKLKKSPSRKPSLRARARSNPQSSIRNQQSAISAKAASAVQALSPVVSGKWELAWLPPADLVPTPDNTRQRIDPKSPANVQLLASVQALGVAEPLQARPHPKLKGKYDLRAGARRLWAALQAKLPAVPVVVHHDLTDVAAYDLTAVENTQREDLAPFEDAEMVLRMLANHGQDVQTVTRILGREPHWVVCRARLVKLIPEMRKAWANEKSALGAWTIRHMEIVARLDPRLQAEILKEYASWQYGYNDTSTRNLQEWIDEHLLHRLKAAPWDLAAATVVEPDGACLECPKRTSCQGLLFIETEDAQLREKNDQCLDAACWQAKLADFLAVRRQCISTETGSDAICVTESYSLGAEERKALESEYGPVRTKNDYSECKAKAPGSTPALVVHGQRLGKTISVKLTSAGGTRRSRGEGGRSAGEATSLADRRKLLESKRWFEVLKMLRAALAKITWAKLSVSDSLLIALASLFGTVHRNDCAGTFERELPGQENKKSWNRNCAEIDPWQLMPTWSGLKESALARSELWRSVRAVLSKRISYNGPITQVPADDIADAKQIAELCGVDLMPLHAKAAETYKEPKSWLNLNADGTAKAKDEKKRVSRKGADNPTPNTQHPSCSASGVGSVFCRHKDGLAVEIRIISAAGPSSNGAYALFAAANGKRINPRKFPERSSIEDAEEDLREYAETNGFSVVSRE